MKEERFLYSSEIDLNGECFTIKVFCSSAGGFFASTQLGNGDIVITDGPTHPETLRKHADLLPLAISSRELNRQFRGQPSKTRGNQTWRME